MPGMQNVFDRIQKHVRASMHTDPQAQSDHLPHPFFSPLHVNLFGSGLYGEAFCIQKPVPQKGDVLSGEFLKPLALFVPQ